MGESVSATGGRDAWEPPGSFMDTTTPDQTDEATRRLARPWAWLRARLARFRALAERARPRRLLFLDDARLEETWDEVHLDHDLGGKTFVDSRDQDCGMEVIRWLCKQPRNHLKATLFFVHTHNAAAGLLMVLQMRACGYKGEFRPFGIDLAQILAQEEPED
jgi:hypothetical protein